MATFSYVQPQPGVFKPWIPIRVRSKKTHRLIPNPLYALIDSGADVCFAKKYIADYLGMKLHAQKNVEFTAANKTNFKAVKDILTITVAGKEYDIPIFFTDEIVDNSPIILGQYGFFDRFRITFDRSKLIEII